MNTRAGVLLAFCLMFAAAAPGATRALVTVVDSKTGAPVTGLKAEDFAVWDDKTPRRVDAVEFGREPLDIMLLLDTSLVGEAVQSVAASLVSQLEPKEQMAVVSYHSSADLIQDFTSSQQLILRAISGVKYGNEPHVLDALYAAIEGGFQNNPFRRVILLLTSGMEGYSRTNERDVTRLARRNQISIYPGYVSGGERQLFESLARNTGGASFNLPAMSRAGGRGDAKPEARVFEALRTRYILTLDGNLGLGEKLRVELKRKGSFQVSALPLE